MSEELLQLLFFAAIFVLLPVLEGVLKRRKKRGRRRGGEPMPEPDWEDGEDAWEPTASRDPSRTTPDREPPPVRARSSEDLLPADLWEELRALARGERTLEPERAEAPGPPETPDRDAEAEKETFRSSPSPYDGAGSRPGTLTEPTEPASEASPGPSVETDRDTRGRTTPGLGPDLTEGEQPSPVTERRPRTIRSRAPRPLPPRPSAGPGPAAGARVAPAAAVPRPVRADVSGASIADSSDAAPTRPSRHAGTFLGQLQEMSDRDLRRAVILREVFGPPLSERR